MAKSKNVKKTRTSEAESTDVESMDVKKADDIDRFDPFNFSALGDLARWPAWPGPRWPERFFGDFSEMMAHIRIEEYVEDDKLVIRGEIPGVDPDSDIDISVEGGRLSIRAHRQSKSEKSDDSSYRSEFRYGSLSRVVALPDRADVDDIEASYTDGILEVIVPLEKTEDQNSKKVKISRG